MFNFSMIELLPYQYAHQIFNEGMWVTYILCAIQFFECYKYEKDMNFSLKELYY